MGETPRPSASDDMAALDFYAPDVESTGSDLDALGEYDPPSADDELPAPTFTVTNPPGTVTVATFVDGRVHRIELSQRATAMTEADLAEEIVVIARLATQNARAAQYTDMLEGMRQQGHDDVMTRDFLTRDLDLPSPDEALAARTRVFTTRYEGDR